MKKQKKRNYSLYLENTTGIAGVFCSICANILGPVIVVISVCYIVNFACQFAGVDFDMFLWIEELVSGIPAMVENLKTFASEMLQKLLGD